ncbi:formimidoylglutamase [Aquimarina sp. U1-2]|uniref:formimidoylglutamase n=1 Tax=Aquimarina sp. U1-2 TaxID=2823141 RepID=UPI001AEC8EB0|nr:formimidoylglutamase [Aquimarina sp. U1-2]MBP2832050.1 formimidoylglutamase [Aquimarina sp. U1-2]
MKNYRKPNIKSWQTSRSSMKQLYFHEKVDFLNIKHDEMPKKQEKLFAMLGFACDEGVRRNKGRTGASYGPEAIRQMLAPLANHFETSMTILDAGDVLWTEANMENTHNETTLCIAKLLQHHIFPIILGGSHDLAHAHYKAIKKIYPNKKIGIINFDAHFDLREVTDRGTSGTPFYQIAQENDVFHYLCLGIQKESNHRELFNRAEALKVQYVLNTEFTTKNKKEIYKTVNDFIDQVDLIYLTIDMDGFSSIYAPGVSAPSPLGFTPDIAMQTIQQISKSNKLVSADVVEVNPKYDIDNCTARLAARLIYHLLSCLS